MEVLLNGAYGALIGLALALTGGGGSIITLPVLVYLVGEDVHDAIGTSLAIVAGIALQGLWGHRRYLDVRTAFVLGAIGTVGTIPGSLLSQLVPGRILLLLFAAVMLAAAVAMLRARTTAIRHDERPHWVALVAAGVALGFLTGFLGVGGGFLIVPTLTLALRFEIRRAIPTSLLVIALNSLVSLATRATVSPIHWYVVAEFFAGGLIGHVAGTYGARALDQRQLKHVFALFVIGVGLFTGGSAAGIIPIHVR